MSQIIRYLVLLLAFVTITNGQTRLVVDNVGYVDWQEEMMRVVATGEPDPGMTPGEFVQRSRERAGANAVEKIRRLVMSIPLNGDKTLDVLLVKEEFNNYLNDFSVQGIQYLKDRRGVALDVEMTLQKLYEAVSAVRKPRSISTDSLKKAAKPLEAIHIDCRGLQLSPALMPRIKDSDGETLFIAGQFGKEWPVKYLKSQEIVESENTFKALKPGGMLKADIVLTAEDAERIKTNLTEQRINDGVKVYIFL